MSRDQALKRLAEIRRWLKMKVISHDGDNFVVISPDGMLVDSKAIESLLESHPNGW